MTSRCNTCGRDIPTQNITLHQLRCVRSQGGDTVARESRSNVMRSNVVDLTDTSSTNWVCGSCTFENTQGDNICSMCSVPRDSASSTLSSTNGETALSTWQCSYCTLLNGNNNNVCEACGHSNISHNNTTDYYSSDSNFNDNIRAADSTYRDQLISDDVNEDFDNLDEMIAALRSNNNAISRGPNIENAVLGALGGALLAATYNSRSTTASSSASQSSDMGNISTVAFGAAVGALGVSLFDAMSARQERHQNNFNRASLEEFLHNIGNDSSVDRGVDTRLLDQLPIRKFNSNECGSNNKECSVCIESFKNGDDVMCLPCFHTYHKNCITPWLKTKSTCPVCKYQITSS